MRQCKAWLLEMIEREATAQLVNDLRKGCAFSRQPARKSSDAEAQPLGDRIRVSPTIRQQSPDLILDRSAN